MDSNRIADSVRQDQRTGIRVSQGGRLLKRRSSIGSGDPMMVADAPRAKDDLYDGGPLGSGLNLSRRSPHAGTIQPLLVDRRSRFGRLISGTHRHLN